MFIAISIILICCMLKKQNIVFGTLWCEYRHIYANDFNTCLSCDMPHLAGGVGQTGLAQEDGGGATVKGGHRGGTGGGGTICGDEALRQASNITKIKRWRGRGGGHAGEM